MPAENGLEFRVSFRKLLIGLLFTVTPICLAGLYSIIQGERSLERTIGNHFKVMAGNTAASVAQYIHDRVTSVAEISIEPELVAAAERANRAYQGMSESASAARIEQIDKTWNTPAADGIVREMLGSAASRLLRRYRDLDRRFLRITVTDEKGATIAATHKSLDYYQADEDYWKDIVANGRGTVSVTDILYDEATKSHYIGIGMPIREEPSQRVIGTVDALVDVSTLFTILNRTTIGPSSRNLLVKEDGTVIAGPDITLSARAKSPEHAAVVDAVGALQGRQTGYVVADLGESNAAVIGFADVNLKENYPKLSWITILAQDTREAFAPVRMVSRLLAFMSLIGLAMVALLAAYFSLHRRQRFSEIGELRPGRRAESTTRSALTGAEQEVRGSDQDS